MGNNIIKKKIPKKNSQHFVAISNVHNLLQLEFEICGYGERNKKSRVVANQGG